MNNSFSHHIATLLRRHDCVIVPGLGAFVATDEPAAVSEEFMTPPRRVVSFNSALTHDDGLLANSLSRRMKISFEQARERVHAESELLHRRLKAEGAVNIARVGSLQRHSGGRLEFTPELPWTLPLPAVKTVKPAPAFEVVRPAAQTEPDKGVAVVRVPLRLRWLRVAAAAVIVGLVGFVLSTPIDIDTAQHATLAAPAFTAPAEPRVEALPEPEGMELCMALPPVDAPAPAKEVAAPATDFKYAIVVASLASREKAQEYIDQSGIPSLQILQSGEKFRVYAGAGSTAEEARSNAERIEGFASRFPDAWACRR